MALCTDSPNVVGDGGSSAASASSSSMERATSPCREANTSGTPLSSASWHQQAVWMAMRPSRSMRRRCMAGTSCRAGVSVPEGTHGAEAHARHASRSTRPGAHAAHCLTEKPIIPRAPLRRIPCALFHPHARMFASRKNFRNGCLRIGKRLAIISLLPARGAIAQLGERLHGMQEVGGSIPPGSTNFRTIGRPERKSGNTFVCPHRLEA